MLLDRHTQVSEGGFECTEFLFQGHINVSNLESEVAYEIAPHFQRNYCTTAVIEEHYFTFD